MYPHSTAVSICQSGIVVLVLFSYPLQLHPARASLDKFLFPSPITPSTSSTPTRALSESDASDSGEESTLSPVEDHVEEEIPLGRFIIESSVILFSTFVIAMFVSSLETVLGFVGATGSTTISFILPSLFCEFSSSFRFPSEETLTARLSCAVLSLFKHSTDPKDKKLRLLAWILLIWGFVVMILSLSMNICEHSFALLLIVRKTDSNRSNIDHLTQKPEGPDSLRTLGLLGGKSSHPAASSILSPTTELPIDG